MAKLDLTYEQTSLLFFELSSGEEHEGFKIIDEGEWADEGKYQYKDIIFEYEGKFWSFSVDRNGSYFSDYYYGFRETQTGVTAHEVEKIEIVQTIWQAVKD